MDFSLLFLYYRVDIKYGFFGVLCFDDMWNLIGFYYCVFFVEYKNRLNMFIYVVNEGVRINVVIEWVDEVFVSYNF